MRSALVYRFAKNGGGHVKSRIDLTSPRTLQKPAAARPGTRRAPRGFIVSGLAWLSLCIGGPGLAAAPELGRLFYTPAQRAQLESARAHRVTQFVDQSKPASTPLRYDGVVIRSDGQTTRWVDGKAQAGTAGVADMKPGQIRAGGKVYEPYQVLRPGPAGPAGPGIKESAP
jgi:hypothetical protein